MVVSRTTSEWEAHLGAQVRRARLLDDIGQADLARDANVSIGALRNLETGAGSSLRTLVKVLRALKREYWLDELEPEPDVSPLALARMAEQRREPQRASRRKAPVG